MISTVHGTKILLPLSTMVHTYCQKQSCEKDNDIASILEKLIANLGNDCTSFNDEKVQHHSRNLNFSRNKRIKKQGARIFLL